MIASVRGRDTADLGLLCEGLTSGQSLTPLLRLVVGGAVSSGPFGQLTASANKELRQAAGGLPEPRPSDFEQTNSTVVFGEQFVSRSIDKSRSERIQSSSWVNF